MGKQHKAATTSTNERCRCRLEDLLTTHVVQFVFFVSFFSDRTWAPRYYFNRLRWKQRGLFANSGIHWRHNWHKIWENRERDEKFVYGDCLTLPLQTSAQFVASSSLSRPSIGNLQSLKTSRLSQAHHIDIGMLCAVFFAFVHSSPRHCDDGKMLLFIRIIINYYMIFLYIVSFSVL